jgi:thiol-disulfide isomerase/thioredoxin
MELPRRSFLALPALAALVAGCSDIAGTDGKNYIEGDGRIVAIDPDERADPVTATGEDLEGNPLSLESYRGKVLVATVWGAWCGPCRTEMPRLVELAGMLDPTTSAVVGVNVRETNGRSAAQLFAQKYEVPFPSFYDLSSSVPLALSSRISGPYTVPASAVVDTDGRVAGLVFGAIPSVRTMRDVVQNVVDTGRVDGAAASGGSGG